MAEIIVSRPNFLASEVGLRLVSTTARTGSALVTTENGRKIIKAGTVYPSNDASAQGIIFQDVDVTDGDAAAPLMVAGHYYSDKVSVDTTAAEALKGKGLFGDREPTVTRPY